MGNEASCPGGGGDVAPRAAEIHAWLTHASPDDTAALCALTEVQLRLPPSLSSTPSSSLMLPTPRSSHRQSGPAMLIAPPGLEMIENVSLYHPAIMSCVERDPRLQERFSEAVPSKMPEAKFWSIYFYKVEFLIRFGRNVEHSHPPAAGDSPAPSLDPPGARELTALSASASSGETKPAPTAAADLTADLTAEGDDDFTLAVHREVAACPRHTKPHV